MVTTKIGFAGRPPGVKTSTNRRRCPDCGGKGKVTTAALDVVKCPTCGGDGGLYGEPPKEKKQ